MAARNPEHKSVRALAWEGLQRWSRGGIFAETIVARAAQENKLSPADRALLQAILYNCLRHLTRLDHISRTLRPGKLEESLRWLVMVGLCQLFVMHQAEHAAVSETVALAPKRARGVVNAILRNSIRRRAEFEAALPKLPLHVRYSTPEWLVQRWVAEFGPADTEAILAWNVQQAPLYARMNPVHPVQELPENWHPVENLPLWFRIDGPVPLEAVKAGQVYITDPSTRYCVELLAPQPGEKVLDACAAPGGKSAAMLAATRGQLDLLATDTAPHRLPALRENLERAGGSSVTVEPFDWTQPCPQPWQGAFDAVLLDVPCSNSGVLQRRVDARWRLDAAEITRLAALQLSIMRNAAAAVRPGGRLVYSTCSIDREEDRAVVDAFLAAHPEFTLERDYLALPHREQADGAYAALLRRAAQA